MDIDFALMSQQPYFWPGLISVSLLLLSGIMFLGGLVGVVWGGASWSFYSSAIGFILMPFAFVATITFTILRTQAGL